MSDRKSLSRCLTLRFQAIAAANPAEVFCGTSALFHLPGAAPFFSKQFIPYFRILITVNISEFGLSCRSFSYHITSFIATVSALVDILSVSGHVFDLLGMTFNLFTHLLQSTAF